MALNQVDLSAFTPQIFNIFGERTPLLTAGDRAACNTMTIGWCQLGRVWRVPTCTVYVRPSRHTFGYMESSDYFTVSILPESMKDALHFCGTKSGRDVDKFAACGLTVTYGAGDAPYIAEAEWVLVCKKLYVQDLDPACMLDQGPIDRHYADGDWHRVYVGQVVEVYKG